jgi:hypothetical protein
MRVTQANSRRGEPFVSPGPVLVVQPLRRQAVDADVSERGDDTTLILRR